MMIGNLNQLWPDPGTMGNFETVLPGKGYGFMFKTGASPYMLNTVTFELINGGNPSALQVELYALQGSLVHLNPNLTPVGQLGNPTADSRPTQWPGYTSFIDFTPSTSTALAPGTYYFIAVNEPVNGDNSNGLTFNFNFSYTISGDWSLPGPFSYWTYLGIPPPAPGPITWQTSASAGSLMLEEDATPVPEPRASILLLLGCALFRGFRWKIRAY
jgi:hypothetical protein